MGRYLQHLLKKLCVRSVPFSASHDSVFSVPFGENRHLDSVEQGRLRAVDSTDRRTAKPGHGLLSGACSKQITKGKKRSTNAYG